MSETFAIVPAGLKPFWILIPVLLILAGAIAMLSLTVHGGSSSRFEVSPAGLRLRGDLYGRMVPANSLRLAEARVVDLEHEPELQPRSRTMGTALPGYRSGWFRLQSGEKALLYLTNPSRAVYIPTRSGYALLLSPEEPDRFLDRLRAVIPSH